MKEDKEKLMQKLLDLEREDINEEFSTDEQVDLQAYEFVYLVLKMELDDGLPHAFKKKLLARIEIEKSRSDDSKFYLIVISVIIFGIIGGVMLTFYFIDFSSQYFKVLSKIIGYMAIIIIAIFIIQCLERKYLVD